MLDRTSPPPGRGVGGRAGARIRRRTALAVLGTLGAGLAAGCSADDSISDQLEQTSTGPSPSTEVTPTRPAADADAQLVDRVLARIARTRDQAAALAVAVPALRTQVREVVRLHAAHGDELGGLPARRRLRVDLSSEDQARERLARLESGLADDLVDAAVQARSGALAQLFASMSAALAQRDLA